MAAMYAVHHGPKELTRIGRQVADRTAALAAHLVDCGFELVHDSFYDTLQVRATGQADDIAATAAESGILLHTVGRSEEHTSALQSRGHLVCRLLLEKKKQYSS